ncbi:SRPBCC family protein [Paracidobacterium acidisoli]|uniref:Uncharacterized protein n=1 Tax=Paracidobacterium acidisoli TaxID=2303751 RepID=A0A372IQ42_9BACT|nr:SRPBCC family protein [Paracidobacterium acidisoli]MBT9331332.1 SRPBCC family protein [Paracidobacterium acidisoli]
MSEAGGPRKYQSVILWAMAGLGIVMVAGVYLSDIHSFLQGDPFWLAAALYVGVPSALATLLALLCLRGMGGQAEVEEAEGGAGKAGPAGIEPAQWGVIALAIAFTAGAILYRWLMHRHLGHSAAMFLGIPAMLAILVALTPQAKTVTGGILKGITLALLIVAPLLGEGYLCILMASPLFYCVGIIVGWIVDWQRGKRTETVSCIALVLLPLCLEGTVPQLTINRKQTVEATRVVDASADAVEEALSQGLDVRAPLPVWLRAGFPRPLWAGGDGLSAGAVRTIHFAGAEGDPPGDLVMRVAERRVGYVRFETVSDGSKLTQWVAWENSEVEWRAVDASHTAVTWRIHFERELDPAWYFTPIERMTVREAAGYLIEANAVPHVTAGATR